MSKKCKKILAISQIKSFLKDVGANVNDFTIKKHCKSCVKIEYSGVSDYLSVKHFTYSQINNKNEKWEEYKNTKIGSLLSNIGLDNVLNCISNIHTLESGIWLGNEFQISVNDGGSFLGEGSLVSTNALNTSPDVINTGSDLHNLNVTRKIGFRQRRRDPNHYHSKPTHFVVPRSIRKLVDEDGNIKLPPPSNLKVNAKTVDSCNLVKFMRANVDTSGVTDIYGNVVSDPLADPRRYDENGELCSCDRMDECGCKILYEDMFIDLGGGTTDYTDEYFSKDLRPVAGQLGYEGKIKEIELAGTRASSRTVVVTTYSNEQQAVTALINEDGTVDGEPQFRMTNDEVEDIFFQEARPLYTFNRYPGRQEIVWGVRGGKVEDPVFNEYGDLIDGFVVVGPNPDTDPNDVVRYGDKKYGDTGNGYPTFSDGGLIDNSPWSDLEVRTPAPEMRFRYPRNNRVYCYNSHGVELLRFQPRTQNEIELEVQRLVNNGKDEEESRKKVEDEEHTHKHMLDGEFGNEICFERKWSVHWHGFDLPHEQDGVPFVAQEQPVECGIWVKAHKPESQLIESGEGDNVVILKDGVEMTLLEAIKAYFAEQYNPAGLYRSGFSHNRLVLGPGIGSHPIYEPRSLSRDRPFVSLEDDLQNPTDRLHDQFIFTSLDKGVRNALRETLRNPIEKLKTGDITSSLRLDQFEDQVLMSTSGQTKYSESATGIDVDGDDIVDIELRKAAGGLAYVFEYTTPNTGTRWNHQHYKTWRTAKMGWVGATPVEWHDDIKVWDREYVLVLSDGGVPTPRFTINGNVFPGTIEWLGGWYKDYMNIEKIEKMDELERSDEGRKYGKYQYKITIVDEERKWLNPPLNHDNKYSNPFNGGPISVGTKTRSMETQIADSNPDNSSFYPNPNDAEKRERAALQEHLRGVRSKQAREYELSLYGGDTHHGHQIINRNKDYGQRVNILGTDIPSLDLPHYVTQYVEGDVGSKTELVLISKTEINSDKLDSLHSASKIMIWRKHKPSLDQPNKQNPGNIGGYIKYNEGEKACLRWINGSASNAHPLHIHGHQWKMLATDGNLNDAPQILNVYFIAVAETFDGVVSCNNPNKQGVWVQHCHNLSHLRNPDNPSPNGSDYPGGMFTNQDYTGWAQKRAVVNHRELTAKLIQMPPIADAGEDQEVGLDCLGNLAIKGKNKVILSGNSEFPTGNVQRNKRLLNFATTEVARYPPIPTGDILYRNGKDKNGHPCFTTSDSGDNVEKDSEGNPIVATRKEVDLRFSILASGEGEFTDANLIADVKGNVTLFDEPFGNMIDGRWMLVDKPLDSEYDFSNVNKFNPLGTTAPLGIGVSNDGRIITNQSCCSSEGEAISISQSPGFFDKDGKYTFQLIGRGINHEYNGDPLAHKLDYGDGEHTTHINGVNSFGGLGTTTLHGKSDALCAERSDGGASEHFPDGFGFDVSGVGGICSSHEVCTNESWCCRKKKMERTIDMCSCKHVAGLVRSDTLNEGDQLTEKDKVTFHFTKELIDDQSHPKFKIHGKVENIRLGFDDDPKGERSEGVEGDRGIITHKLWKAILSTPPKIEVTASNEGEQSDEEQSEDISGDYNLTSRLGGSEIFTSSKGNKIVSMRNDPRIKTLGRSNVVVIPGSERGTISQPLFKGTISKQNVIKDVIIEGTGEVRENDGEVVFQDIITSDKGDTVYFLVTDSSNKKLASIFGAIHAPTLSDAPLSSCELWNGSDPKNINDIFTSEDGVTSFLFENDFGLVSHYGFDESGEKHSSNYPIGPIPNTNYSPLKRFKFLELTHSISNVVFNKNESSLTFTENNPIELGFRVGMELRVSNTISNNNTYKIKHINDEKIIIECEKLFEDEVVSECQFEGIDLVTLVMPIISYSDSTQENGKEYLCDHGGQNPLIRNNPPNPVPSHLLVGMGPPNSYGEMRSGDYYLGDDDDEGVTFEGPLQRYHGGKCLVINKNHSESLTTNYLYNDGTEFKRLSHTVPPLSVLSKLDKGTLLNNGIVPYYTVFEASAPPPAGFMGVPHTPKLSALGRGKDVISTTSQKDYQGVDVEKGDTIKRLSTAVATLFQFDNGVFIPDGGPNRFQPGIVPFAGDSPAYTPMWHINFVYYNCGVGWCGPSDDQEQYEIGDVISGKRPFRKDRNVSVGGAPSPGSEIPKFDPTSKNDFDPFQLSCGLKKNQCNDYIKSKSKDGSDTIYLDEIEKLKDDGSIFITEAPGGAEQGWKKFLIVNCPLPVICDMNVDHNCGDTHALRSNKKLLQNLRDENSDALHEYKFFDSDANEVAHGDSLDVLLRGEGVSMVKEERSDERLVYFLITDVSDKDIASKFGAIFSPILNEAPDEACELDVEGSLDIFGEQSDENGNIFDLEVHQDPGRVCRIIQDVNDPAYSVNGLQVGDFAPPIPNPNYSPMKRLFLGGKCVTINMSMISWGDIGESGEQAQLQGKQFVVDKGGKDPRVRAIPPSQFWMTANDEWPQSGPPGATDEETALERYKGGQALKIDLDGEFACWKLHKASFTSKQIPYYTAFEASTPPAAGFMGVPFTPKLSHLGRGKDVQKRSSVGDLLWLNEEGEETSDISEAKLNEECKPVPSIIPRTNSAVATLDQFGNGVSTKRAGGPNRFQEGLVPFTGESPAYTPMWHINFLFYNCTGSETGDAFELFDEGVLNDSQFDENNNVAFGAVASGANANNKFKGQLSLPVFDPFQMNGLKGRKCDEYVKFVTKTENGILLNDGQVSLSTLKKEGKIFGTEAPPGAPEGWNKFLIVNCPLPMMIDLTPPPQPTSNNSVTIPLREPTSIGIIGSENTINWILESSGEIIENSLDINDMPSVFNLEAGDTITIKTDSNSHGVGFSGGKISDIFSSLSTSTPLIPFPSFESVIGGEVFGTIPSANETHFSGTVNSGFAGTIIKGVCTFHGPSSMQFVFRINS